MSEMQNIKLRLNFNESFPYQIGKASITISDTVILKQEKDYQKLIGEKLKSAETWHMRELKSLSVG